MRDPRINPMVGDIVEVRDGRSTTILSVEELTAPSRITFRRSSANRASVLLDRPLSAWRIATLGCDVLTRAEELT